MAQFIPGIYNKIIIKILRYFWGATTFDKTIQPKELSKETTKDVQNESLRDDEVFDGPNVPRTDVVDVDLEKDKASHVPPAPYPHRLRVPKKVNNHSEIYELFK